MSDTQHQVEFEDTDPSREIGVDPDKHSMYKELETNPGSPFYEEELVDIWLVRVYPDDSTAGTARSREIISLFRETRLSSSYGLRPCWRHVASRDSTVS